MGIKAVSSPLAGVPIRRKLASASWLDNTLRVWDVASGKTEWQALRLDNETTVTVSPLGFPVQGDPDVLDASLLYGLEQRDGTLDLLTPSEFRKQYGTKLLPSLVNRFNKFTEAHELTRSESELALALTLRADVDTKGRIRLAETAEQLALALHFGKEYGRAEQAMRTAIEVQEQVVAESPDDPSQKNALSYQWAELGKVLSAAGRNTEALVEISRAIESRRQRFDANPEGRKASL